MAGEFAQLRKLPPELHEQAIRLVAEVMASTAIQALTEREKVIHIFRAGDQNAPSFEAFRQEASDFLDIRGDLVEWILEQN